MFVRLLIIAIVLNAFPAFAGTYYVSNTGSGTTCSSGSPCALSYANTNAVAGDIWYLKGGTYSLTGNGIDPDNNGTNASTMITYASATGETPILTKASGTVYAIELSGVKFIKVSGITVNNVDRWANLTNGSNHNEITGCTFENDLSFLGTTGIWIQGGTNQNWVTHNWIHGNALSNLHRDGNCTDDGSDMVKIGAAYGTFSGNPLPGDNYNTVENNVITYNSHAGLDNYAMYTVIKNNVWHNEPWLTNCKIYTWPPTYVNANYDGKFGHRNFQITEDYDRIATYVLVEGNRVGHASANPTNDGADNFDLAAPQNIVRFNYFYNAMQNGLMFKYNYNSGVGGGGRGGTNNRVYNNTFYNNGIGYDYYYNGGEACPTRGSVCPGSIANIALYADTSGLNNVIKNNLMYQGGSNTNYTLDTVSRSGVPASIYPHVAYMDNNWCTTDQDGCTSYGDPKFVNPDITDPTSLVLPNLSLQSSSTAINGGTSLTLASGAGNASTALIVDDALYFQDGTWGSDLARGVTLFPDWIAIGTVTNVVQISSINYATNTITLASPMTWADDAPIWLYKKSDGAIVLYGSAPDYGANEYIITGAFTGSMN
jgi:hypothetical protein